MNNSFSFSCVNWSFNCTLLLYEKNYILNSFDWLIIDHIPYLLNESEIMILVNTYPKNSKIVMEKVQTHCRGAMASKHTKKFLCLHSKTYSLWCTILVKWWNIHFRLSVVHIQYWCVHGTSLFPCKWNLYLGRILIL